MEEPLDSRQLKAFVLLSKTGSYTETAKKLFVTHSAISHAMRALESDVGCRLLANVNKKVMLTDAGEALLQHAELVLKEMTRARTTLTALNKWGSRRLRVSAETALGAYFLTQVLVEFHQKFPRVLVNLELFNCCETHVLLAANRTDLVFSEKPIWDGRFEFFGLFDDLFQIVVSAKHPWALKGLVNATEFPTAPFVLHRTLGESQKMVTEYLLQKNVVLNTAAEMDGLEAVKEFVKQTESITILPTWAVKRELTDGSLVVLPLGRKPLAQTWGFTHWRHRPLNHTEASFLEICRNVLGPRNQKVSEPIAPQN